MTKDIRLRITLLVVLFTSNTTLFAQDKWPGVILYNLEFNGISKELIIDPAVRVSKGEFSYPLPIPPDSWDREDSKKILQSYFDKFNKAEYPKGRKIQIYIDGTKAGTAQIKGLDTVNSCSPVVSEIRAVFDDSLNHPFRGHGLAISGLPPRKPILSFPIDSTLERSLAEYGKAEFIRRGVSTTIAAQMEIKNLRAIDIDNDGTPEYLADFFIIGEDVKRGDLETNIQYSLSVILKRSNLELKPVFIHYPDPGIGEDTHLYKFIDVIDLDGDGNCEILVQQIISMSSWNYILLKKKGNTWESFYEGAGSGC
ncbi:MAG: hypothetical protein ABI778_11085 [Ignavibacteriota bacterium]